MKANQKLEAFSVDLSRLTRPVAGYKICPSIARRHWLQDYAVRGIYSTRHMDTLINSY